MKKKAKRSLAEIIIGVVIIVTFGITAFLLLSSWEGIVPGKNSQEKAAELTDAIRKFTVEQKAFPVTPGFTFPPLGSASPICTEEYAQSLPADCVNLLPLLEYGYTEELPHDGAHDSERSTGFFYRVCDGGEIFLDVITQDRLEEPIPCF